MTLTSDELRRARGVAEAVIEWRKWRRSMCLTVSEAAAMAEISADWLHRTEIGKVSGPNTATLAKLQALMARWTEDMRPPQKIDRRRGRRDGRRGHDGKYEKGQRP